MDRLLLSKQVDITSDTDLRKHRKYNDNYLDFRFTSIEVNNEEKPQCVLWLKILSSELSLCFRLS